MALVRQVNTEADSSGIEAAREPRSAACMARNWKVPRSLRQVTHYTMIAEVSKATNRATDVLQLDSDELSMRWLPVIGSAIGVSPEKCGAAHTCDVTEHRTDVVCQRNAATQRTTHAAAPDGY